MREIATSNRAQFEYWVQKKWNVLPTDQRYRDLTKEQMELLFEHYMIELDKANPKKDNKFNDDDFSREYSKVDSEGGVISEVENFEDPDFDEVWNSTEEDEKEEVSPSNIIGEFPPKSNPLVQDPKSVNPPQMDIDFDDFEEVD